MPTVPRYDNPTQQLNALPNARKAKVVTAQELAQPAEQMGQLANAGERAGSDLSDIEYQMQERENTQQVMQAEASLKQDQLNFTQQLQQRQGQNAWGATRDAQKWWGETARKYLLQMKNPAQHEAMQKIIAQRRDSSLDQVSQYEADQRRQSLNDAANASIVASINTAAASPTDPQVVQQENRSLTNTVRAQAVTQGWTPEVAQQKLLKAKTKLHESVLQNLMDKNPQAAREYYDAHKDEIAGADQGQLEKELDAAGVKGDSQRLADQYVQTGNLSDALAKARQLKNPDLRDATVRRVKEQFADQQSAQQLAQKQASGSAWKVVAGGGTINDIPSKTWNTMSGPQQIEVRKYLSAKADKQLKGRSEDDLGVYMGVQQKIEDGDIKSPEQLQRYEPYLTTSTLKTLSHAIQKNATVPQSDVRQAYEARKGETFSKIIAGDSDRQNWLAFQSWINQNIKENHRPGDLQKLADQWFMDGYASKGGWFHSNEGPSTFGDAVMQHDTKGYKIKAPDQVAPTIDNALPILKKYGVQFPTSDSTGSDSTATRDEVYAQYYLPAQRWLAAHKQSMTPEALAAYAFLVGEDRVVTPSSFNHVLQQINRR